MKRYPTHVPRSEMLDRPRTVHHADVLFDSNVVQANDDAGEQRLHDLTALLVNHPDQGNIWFSPMTLAELVAPRSPAKRIELLRRFRNLYSRFGERVRFMRSLADSVRAECLGTGIPSAPAAVVEQDVAGSIVSGSLVGLLRDAHDDWQVEKQRLRANYDRLTERNQQSFANRADIRSALRDGLALFFSAGGLNFCDDIALDLVVDSGTWVPFEMVMRLHQNYPCIWTFSTMARLAQFAQTVSDVERPQFHGFEDVLEPHRNDFIDADIAGTGGRCGMMITNDHSLLLKVNRLHDAGLIRLQAFTVMDTLVAYNPPNGRTRSL